jgi:hypothetical protein
VIFHISSLVARVRKVTSLLLKIRLIDEFGITPS